MKLFIASALLAVGYATEEQLDQFKYSRRHLDNTANCNEFEQCYTSFEFRDPIDFKTECTCIEEDDFTDAFCEDMLGFATDDASWCLDIEDKTDDTCARRQATHRYSNDGNFIGSWTGYLFNKDGTGNGVTDDTLLRLYRPFPEPSDGDACVIRISDSQSIDSDDSLCQSCEWTECGGKMRFVADCANAGYDGEINACTLASPWDGFRFLMGDFDIGQTFSHLKQCGPSEDTTMSPTKAPAYTPTAPPFEPTLSPTRSPSLSPTFSSPTLSPTPPPSNSPTEAQTMSPTRSPVGLPTSEPTSSLEPTHSQTAVPSNMVSSVSPTPRPQVPSTQSKSKKRSKTSKSTSKSSKNAKKKDKNRNDKKKNKNKNKKEDKDQKKKKNKRKKKKIKEELV